jgi:YVTN family beta-propeller protein
VRGIDMDVGRDALYIAHGGNGGSHGTGSLMRYDLTTGQVVWDHPYPFGIDQFAYYNGVIYMPTGSHSSSTDTTWEVLDADTGDVLSQISGGSRPHNTICHGSNVYMGGEGATALYTAGATAATVGPGPTRGVRPFTVNATDSRAYITWSYYRGFSVGDLTTGQILANVSFGPVPSTFKKGDTASHGISLSPDGTELYVLDKPAQQVEVWTASDSPTQLAVINLQTPIKGHYTLCAYSCGRDGWLLHSLDGRYVFVGDSGDVIDTQTRQVVTNIPPLRNTRHGFLEVDWAGGVPVATTTHFGVGR